MGPLESGVGGLPSDQKQTLLISARLEEARYLFESSRSHFLRADQAIALGVTFIGAVSGLAISQDFQEILVAVPAGLLMLATYVLQTYADVIVMETARSRIEHVLSEQLDEPPLIYQSFANRRERGVKTWSVPVAAGVLPTLFLLATIRIGSIAASIGDTALAAYIVVTGLIASITIAAARDLAKAGQQTRENVRSWPAGVYQRAAAALLACEDKRDTSSKEYAVSATTAILPWPLTTEGDSEHPVQTLQHLLRARGQRVTVDGIFGPHTTAAVRAFQQNKGLAVDGDVGPLTWAAIIVQVKRGDTGDAVRGVQEEFQFRNLSGDPTQGVQIDGIFGPDTDAAVRGFQQALGLAVDGIVGPLTWRALVSGMLSF
jgi:hypothetical protein